ncbi:hypothetical protein EsH8_VIII_000249 [Colletotrichum jinshuiense]
MDNTDATSTDETNPKDTFAMFVTFGGYAGICVLLLFWFLYENRKLDREQDAQRRRLRNRRIRRLLLEEPLPLYTPEDPLMPGIMSGYDSVPPPAYDTIIITVPHYDEESRGVISNPGTGGEDDDWQMV